MTWPALLLTATVMGALLLAFGYAVGQWLDNLTDDPPCQRCQQPTRYDELYGVAVRGATGPISGLCKGCADALVAGHADLP